MAVRNFWIEGHVDGRRTPLTGGPQSKDGGFSLDIYQRVDGSPVRVAQINGHAYNGDLTLRVEPDDITYREGLDISYVDGIVIFKSKRDG